MVHWFWVLNLIINGLPSIHSDDKIIKWATYASFKPYYKWITFNTGENQRKHLQLRLWVLNLIINGLPSIPVGSPCSSVTTNAAF